MATQGTVQAATGFDPEKDGEVLRKAMKGLGTDEKAIIDILCYRSNEQRQEIKSMYKTMYGRDLIPDLKSELGGNFEDVIVALMTKPADFDAKELRDAISGAGTNEITLIEVMCSRTNAEMAAINEAYKRLYKKTLEEDLKGDTSGHFRKLMISLANGGRREDAPVDPAKAATDAKELFTAGEGRWGTDESKFNRVLCTQSAAQLQCLFTEYTKLSSKAIEDAIKSEMSGDLETGMLAVVKVARNKSAFFAQQLYKSMKGLGTDDRALIRLVVTRSEIDMAHIKQEFYTAYGKTLHKFIEGDCSGDYKKCLLALVKN